MAAKDVDEDEESAVRIFASYLVQQVGGRDWSAQEVSHVNMGLRTVWGSHDFNQKSLVMVSRLRNNITPISDEAARADVPSDFELYLRRGEWTFEGANVRAPNQPDPWGNMPSNSLANDIASCSFVDFYRKYEYRSAGPGKKDKRTIHRIDRPAVCVIKPQMPRSWGHRGHAKRADYCRVQLQAYMPFKDEIVAGELVTATQHYHAYMAKHGGDFEQAYEEFAASPDAPSSCRDDLKPVVFEDEGSPVGDEHGEAHEGFAIFEATSASTLEKTLRIEPVDWWARNNDRYSDALLADAARWQARVKVGAAPPAPVQVDPTQLNDGQAFVYRVVQEHDAAWRRDMTRTPLRALVCGTAGAGKTFLIRALKQLLGDACIVCAPTGVAADNIGGRTYHSLLPMPRVDIDRDDIKLSEGPRLTQMKVDLHGVTYLILDEMSMVGRRSLAHIDEMLRQAKGSDEKFGNMNIILVGKATLP